MRLCKKVSVGNSTKKKKAKSIVTVIIHVKTLTDQGSIFSFSNMNNELLSFTVFRNTNVLNIPRNIRGSLLLKMYGIFSFK